MDSSLISPRLGDPSIEHLVIAGTKFAHLVAAVPDAGWNRPTPCPRWDVRTLVAHTLTIAEALVHFASGNEMPPPVRGIELHGARHTADRFALAVERGRTAWQAVTLEESRDFPWGTTPARRLLDFSTVEFLAHAWDLAVATGAPIAVPEQTIEAAAVTVRSGLRDVAPPGDFAGPVPVPATASPLDRFVGLVGRSPRLAR